MVETLSFLSWNVEHFHHEPERVGRVVETVASQDPDVFALFEVKGRTVFDALTETMPGYGFFITESPGVPEILVATRNGLTAFVTQRDELQSGVPTLRPGALATIRIADRTYSFLFLHLKSFPAPRDWGLRDDMFAHVASLKRAIDKRTADGDANFVAIGDINTMGLNAPHNDDLDIDGARELSFVDRRMAYHRTRMRRLTKTHHETWWNGSDRWQPSALDHAYAANHLAFTPFDGAELRVEGWVNEPTVEARKTWIDRFSDHCLLYGELRLEA